MKDRVRWRQKDMPETDQSELRKALDEVGRVVRGARLGAQAPNDNEGAMAWARAVVRALGEQAALAEGPLKWVSHYGHVTLGPDEWSWARQHGEREKLYPKWAA